jgi:hypothetical protein
VHVGKYQLVRKLATGGMAEVFLAKSRGPRGFEKTVVVKRILPHLVEDPQFVDMFLTEAQLAAKLDHPNLVQIFDFGESDGEYFLAMEYIDGPNLRSVAKRCVELDAPIPLTVAAKIIALVCDGLAYAHELVDPESGEPLKLVHRDISPDNILVSRNGNVKLVDFGIAKAATQVHRTQTGLVKGKIAYMPREQLLNKPLDLRTDVYALGVVLYELVTGLRPLDADSDVLLMQAILNEGPIPVSERRPDLPGGLQRAIDTAIAKEREDRHQSCRDMQAELDQFILHSGRPVGSLQLAQLVAQMERPDSGSAREGGRTPPRDVYVATRPISSGRPAAAAPASGEKVVPEATLVLETQPAKLDPARPTERAANGDDAPPEGQARDEDARDREGEPAARAQSQGAVRRDHSEGSRVDQMNTAAAGAPSDPASVAGTASGGPPPARPRPDSARALARRLSSIPPRVLIAAGGAGLIIALVVVGFIVIGSSRPEPVAQAPQRTNGPPTTAVAGQPADSPPPGLPAPEHESIPAAVGPHVAPGPPVASVRRTPSRSRPTAAHDAGEPVAAVVADVPEPVAAPPPPPPSRIDLALYAKLTSGQRKLMDRCDRVEKRIHAAQRAAPDLSGRLSRVRNDVARADTKHRQNVLAVALDEIEYHPSLAGTNPQKEMVANPGVSAATLQASTQPTVATFQPPSQPAAPTAAAPTCHAEMSAECIRLRERLVEVRRRWESSNPPSRAVALSKLLRIQSRIEKMATLSEATAIGSDLDAFESEFIILR